MISKWTFVYTVSIALWVAMQDGHHIHLIEFATFPGENGKELAESCFRTVARLIGMKASIDDDPLVHEAYYGGLLEKYGLSLVDKDGIERDASCEVALEKHRAYEI